MAAEAAIEHHQEQGTPIALSPAAKIGIMLSIRAWRSRLRPILTIRQLTLAGADYAYLDNNRSLFTSPDGRRYLQSDELRMTLASLMGAGLEDALEAAFDKSREQLVFRGTFPHPEFLQRLVEKFVASTTPRHLRRVLLISEEDLPESTSASFHLPQAYDTAFPCSRCTTDGTEDETDLLVEVFHFVNRNDPSLCATVSFRMSADAHYIATPDSRVEIYLTESCRPRRAPFARPSRKLFTQYDTFFQVLREVNTDGLEKLQAVSRGWCATIDRHKRALPRRRLLVEIVFHGNDPSILTVHVSRWNGEYEQVLRVLVPRSPEQLSRLLREHLRDAVVKLVFFSNQDSLRHPPQDAMFHWDQSKALAWATCLFRSLKRTQIKRMRVDSDLFGIDNLPALMMAARLSCRLGTLDLIHFSSDDEDDDDAFTAREVVGLLRDPTAVALDKVVVRMMPPSSTDDYSMLEDYLFSTPTPAFELRLCEWHGVPDPPTTILTFPDRYYPHGMEANSRVYTYRNAHTGEVLSVVLQIDDTYHTKVLFLKGHVALDTLRNKWANDKYCLGPTC